MVTTRTFSEQRVVLRNISWQTIETMLAEMGNDRASRMAYDRGTLEIMTPLMPHEHWNCLLKLLIFVLGDVCVCRVSVDLNICEVVEHMHCPLNGSFQL